MNPPDKRFRKPASQWWYVLTHKLRCRWLYPGSHNCSFSSTIFWNTPLHQCAFTIWYINLTSRIASHSSNRGMYLLWWTLGWNSMLPPGHLIFSWISFQSTYLRGILPFKIVSAASIVVWAMPLTGLSHARVVPLKNLQKSNLSISANWCNALTTKNGTLATS